MAACVRHVHTCVKDIAIISVTIILFLVVFRFKLEVISFHMFLTKRYLPVSFSMQACLKIRIGD